MDGPGRNGPPAHACRVAIIEPVGGHGGMEHYDVGLCEALVKAGVRPVLYTSNKTNLPAARAFDFVACYRGIFGPKPAWWRGLRFVRGLVEALRHCSRRETDICHMHFFHVGLPELITLLAVKAWRMRSVVTVHDVEAFESGVAFKLAERYVYHAADRLIVHNQTCTDELERVFSVPRGRVSVIPHGSYLHAVATVPDSIEARRRLGIGIDRKVILFFGRIKAVKGLDVLLEALPQVIDRCPDVQLVIAGAAGRTDADAIRLRVADEGLGSHCIVRTEFIPDPEVPDYYAAADLVVLPYRRIYQSGVLLMSMSYRRAVLVSDLKGMTEMVTDGHTGFVFRAGDATHLATRISEILPAEDLRAHVAEAAYRYLKTNHDWAEIGTITASCYRRVLKDSGGS